MIRMASLACAAAILLCSAEGTESGGLKVRLPSEPIAGIKGNTEKPADELWGRAVRARCPTRCPSAAVEVAGRSSISLAPQRYGDTMIRILHPDHFLVERETPWLQIPRHAVSVTGEEAHIYLQGRANRAEGAARDRLLRRYSLYSVAFLMSLPAACPAERTYVGEEYAPSGAVHVVNLRGRCFAMSAVIDRATHRLIGLRFPYEQVAGDITSRPETSETGTGELNLSDFRLVDGAVVPFRLDTDWGSTRETLEVTRVTVGAQLTPLDFRPGPAYLK